MSGWQSNSQPSPPPFFATNGLEIPSGFGGFGSEAYQTYQANEIAQQGYNHNVGFAHQDFVGQHQVYQGYQAHSNGGVGHQRHQGLPGASAHQGGRHQGYQSYSIGSVGHKGHQQNFCELFFIK